MSPAEDRIALRALVDEYGFAADARDRERFCAVFAADAELLAFDAAGRLAASYRGHEELGAVITDVLPKFGVTFHQMTSFGLRLSGELAEGEVNCAAHHLGSPESGAKSLVMLIRYADKYERSSGSWRIARREARVAWIERHEVLRGEP